MRVTATRLGLMIDALCNDVLGFDNAGVVERALALNPGLAATLCANGHALPLDLPIVLPDAGTITPADTSIKLWD